jgi:hypothetical protein
VPTFRPLDSAKIQELTSRRGAGLVDLTDQKDWINRAVYEASGWGAIAIDSGENVRAIKRRTTIAGKELGKTIKWHRKSSNEELIFRALDPSEVTRRTRRSNGAAPEVPAEPKRRRTGKSD